MPMPDVEDRSLLKQKGDRTNKSVRAIGGLGGGPFMVGEFVAHGSSPQVGSLNHGSPAKRNAPGPLLVRRLRTGADIN